MSRIVDPVFADIRWEDGQVSWRGCVALGKALSLHAVLSLPGWCAAVCTDDSYAVAKTAGLLIPIALLAALPLLAPPLINVRNRTVVSPVTLAMMSLPQAIALTLPISLLIAISLVLKRPFVTWRLIRRTALLSVAVAVLNFAVVFSAIPNANQSFRDALVRALPANAHVHFERGAMEMDRSSLKRKIASLPHTRGGERSARRLEYSYQLRLAIVTAAIPLGLAGLAVSVSQREGRRALSILGIVIGCWTLMAVAQRIFNALNDADVFFPEYLCAWAPNVILMIIASATLVSRRSVIRPRSASGLA